MIKFPEDFIWGTATASYQIEGGAFEGGRIPSIWDTFSKTPGNVKNGDTGDIACDHYNKYKEDIKLMKELGIKAFRLSLAWPRVFKDGKNEINEEGLAFYDKLLDELKANGIKTNVTLYHWDLPQCLQDEGGWANPKIVEYFRNYAETVFKRFDGKVDYWSTFNEPSIFVLLGHLQGIHAPGIKNLWTTVNAVHNVLLSHGAAVKAFRDGNYKGEIGIVINLTWSEPYADCLADKTASDKNQAVWNYMFMDPVLKGEYPELILKDKDFGIIKEVIKDGDMEKIYQKLDFVGVNYYFRSVMRYNPAKPFEYEQMDVAREKTEFGWEVSPEGLYNNLIDIKERYGDIPVFITENGAAYWDKIKDKKIDDFDRIDYLKRHFTSAHKAIEAGVNLKGYYVWSLMDNYEWAEGYARRFGLIYINFETLERIPKASYYWYKKVIESSEL